MLALSVSQPWGWLITHNLKDIENRTYPPPHNAIGQSLLIHAPLKPDEAAWDTISRVALPVWHRKGTVITELAESKAYAFGGIIGVATLAGVVRQSASPWFVGPYGWVFRDAYPLPFVRYPGKPIPFQVHHHRLECLVRAKEDYIPSRAARTIYTLGYRTPGAFPLLEHLAESRCPIIDCRYWPWSKVPHFQQFDREALQQSLGLLYLHMPELGNKNFNNPNKSFALVDETAGIESALGWLYSMGKICLLCGCQNPWECHRGLIAKLLLERARQEAPRIPTHIAHLQASQFLPHQTASSLHASLKTTQSAPGTKAQGPAAKTAYHPLQLTLWQEIP